MGREIRLRRGSSMGSTHEKRSRAPQLLAGEIVWSHRSTTMAMMNPCTTGETAGWSETAFGRPRSGGRRLPGRGHGRPGRCARVPAVWPMGVTALEPLGHPLWSSRLSASWTPDRAMGNDDVSGRKHSAPVLILSYSRAGDVWHHQDFGIVVSDVSSSDQCCEFG